MPHEGTSLAPVPARDQTLSLPTISQPVEALLAVAHSDTLPGHRHVYPVSTPEPRTMPVPSTAHGAEGMTVDLPVHRAEPISGAMVGDHGRVTVLSELRAHPYRLALIFLAAVPLGYLASRPLVGLTSRPRVVITVAQPPSPGTSVIARAGRQPASATAPTTAPVYPLASHPYPARAARPQRHQRPPTPLPVQSHASASPSSPSGLPLPLPARSHPAQPSAEPSSPESSPS